MHPPATVSEKKAEAAFENMEKQAKRLAKADEDAGVDASEAMQKAAWKDVQANADAFGTNATENFKNVGTAAENAGTSIESRIRKTAKCNSLLLDWHMEQRKSRKSARITNRL